MSKQRTTPVFAFLILTSMSGWVHGQTLILKNGQTIIGKDIQYKNGSVLVKVEGKEATYPKEEVVGYFEKEGPVFYLKFIPEGEPDRPEYDFFERVADGKITLYKEINRDLATDGRAIQLYAEKGDSYGCVSTFYQGKRYLQLLKAMVKDRPDFLARVEDPKFLYTPDGVVNLISEYNLAEFKPTSHDGTQTSATLLYLMYRPKAFMVKITVDNKTSYDLPLKQGLSLALPSHELSKVCASYGNLQSCLLIRGIPYLNQYFKVDYGGKQIKFEPSDKSDANYNLTKASTYH